MSHRSKCGRVLAGLVVLGAAVVSAQDSAKQGLDREFRAAVADYEAGHYAAAAQRLERIAPRAPKSYDLQELMGLVYGSLGRDQEAVQHLTLAVQLRPESGEAHTNLGATLLRAGQVEAAGTQLRKALELEPKSYDANHDLGEYYVRAGRLAEAEPLLKAAQTIQPGRYDNGYDLALAELMLSHFGQAREVVQSLIRQKDSGELRNLLGQIDEKDGKFIDAANDLQAAAHLDPSEENIFDWASEMLLHRTLDPAITIFQQGSERYPKSVRMKIGLGLALYSRGKYDDAVKALIAAADLSPNDPRCYLFLSKAYHSSPGQADDVIERFRRYADAEPNNAAAQYYLAISMWKGKRVEDASETLGKVEGLLQKAIALDPKLTEAHVQLGSLYADEHKFEPSAAELQKALELNANLPDAHYRLATDYVHLGQKDAAQKEFAIYQKQRADHLAQEDKERADVRQFVYAEKNASEQP